MMAVDASAVLAVLLNEPEANDIQALLMSRGGLISAVNYWEVLVRARTAAGNHGRDLAEALLIQLGVQVAPVEAEDARRAADAFEQFGKGSGGRLNLGDCFAYALAQREGEGLLFKGNDFPKTDVTLALG